MMGLIHSPAALMLLGLQALLFSASGTASAAAVVKYLPGFDGPLPFHLETGYIGVGETEEYQLFYYFVKSERNPDEDPLLLWVSGGPGCSSLTGLAYENGPLSFNVVEYNGSLPTLRLNHNSWTKVSSIIFLDLPVASGFSYPTDGADFRSSDTIQAPQAVEFLRKWLTENSKFRSNPVYIAGDSYAGIPHPVTLQLISIGNEMGIEPKVNLKGYILGNPVTDDRFEANARIPAAHGLTIISDEFYQSLKTSCGGEYKSVEPTNYACVNSVAAFYKYMRELYMENPLYPKCGVASRKPMEINLAKRRSMTERDSLDAEDKEDYPEFGCPTYPHLLSFYWADDEAVRKALHVRQNMERRWIRCNKRSDYVHDVNSSFENHVYLSTKGYRSLIYSGDHDLVCPTLGTQAWIRALNYSIVEDWRSWHVGGQVAGYTRTYSNRMTFATVKGAGHVAIEYKPGECSAMFKRWIDEEPL